MPHSEDVPSNIILSRNKLLLHLASECNLLLNGRPLPLSGFLNADNIVAFVLVAKDAVDAEQIGILLAERFELLAMQDAFLLWGQFAVVVMV